MRNRSVRRERTNPHVRLMAALGIVGLIVIAGTTVVFAVAWPSATIRSSQVPVALFAYDPATGALSGSSQTTFHEGEMPAAILDVEAIADPPSGTVNAAWFDSLGYRTNSVDRPALHQLTEPVPVSTSAVPRGSYQFVLTVTDQGGEPEVLTWIHVEIER